MSTIVEYLCDLTIFYIKLKRIPMNIWLKTRWAEIGLDLSDSKALSDMIINSSYLFLRKFETISSITRFLL